MGNLTNQGTAGPSIDAVSVGTTVERRSTNGVFEVNDDATNLANLANAPVDPAFSLIATDDCTLIWCGMIDAAPTLTFGNIATVGRPIYPLNLSTPAPGDLYLREPLAQGGRQLIAWRSNP